MRNLSPTSQQQINLLAAKNGHQQKNIITKIVNKNM